MTHSYFIFIHDVDLIETLEERGTFKYLDNYQYVLLSKNEQTTNRQNVIIAKDCKQNIEDHKNYLQFTGWFCLVANKLIKTDYVTLMEYDVKIDRYINNSIINNINKDLACYGYASLPKTNSFLNNDIFSNGLVSYLQSLNISIPDIINNTLNDKWIVTSNITIKTDVFTKLVKSDLCIGLLNYLKNNPFSGHFLERFTTVFLTLNNLNYSFIENSITHYAVDSHNTQNRNHVYQIFKKEELTKLL
jgi:hypothetical protein